MSIWCQEKSRKVRHENDTGGLDGYVAGHRGTAFEDVRKWNDELRNDFKLLREVGHEHPDMARIEAMLEAGK